MDRLTAVEQSIFVEAELSALFNSFATAFYNKPEVQDFWRLLARAEASHTMMLVSEKWRIVREEIDGSGVKYDDPALLKQMRKFDGYRQSVVMPAEIEQALDLALRAESTALEFHNTRIFIADFGISDQVLQALVDAEEFHHEILTQLSEAKDPEAELKKIETERLMDFPPE